MTRKTISLTPTDVKKSLASALVAHGRLLARRILESRGTARAQPKDNDGDAPSGSIDANTVSAFVSMPNGFRQKLEGLTDCENAYWDDVRTAIAGSMTYVTLGAFLAAHEAWKVSSTATTKVGPATRVLVDGLTVQEREPATTCGESKQPRWLAITHTFMCNTHKKCLNMHTLIIN